MKSKLKRKRKCSERERVSTREGNWEGAVKGMRCLCSSSSLHQPILLAHT